MKNKDQIPSSEEIAEIQEERTLSDAELIKGGAEYKADEKGNVTLGPTRRQLKTIVKEHDEQESTKEQLDGMIGTLEKALGVSEKKDKIKTLELPKGVEFLKEITIGGKTKDELIKEMEEYKVLISDGAKSMMNNPDFITLQKQEDVSLVIVCLESLGFSEPATIDQIYEKAKKLGLELCPAEVGPQFRLLDIRETDGYHIFVGMKPISDSEGYPCVFGIGGTNISGKPELNERQASPDDRWSNATEFVFVLPRK